MRHGKNYVAAANKIDRSKLYEVEDALALAVETSTAKFDETIELHVKLGVDPRNAEQQVRGSVVLPNGTGKSVKVLVIAKGQGSGHRRRIRLRQVRHQPLHHASGGHHHRQV